MLLILRIFVGLALCRMQYKFSELRQFVEGRVLLFVSSMVSLWRYPVN